jgi:hypothetical protein
MERTYDPPPHRMFHSTEMKNKYLDNNKNMPKVPNGIII